MEKAIELALAGDISALKLCLERLIPKVVHVPVTLNFYLSQANKLQYLTGFGCEILSAVSSGEIVPSDARVLANIVDVH